MFDLLCGIIDLDKEKTVLLQKRLNFRNILYSLTHAIITVKLIATLK